MTTRCARASSGIARTRRARAAPDARSRSRIALPEHAARCSDAATLVLVDCLTLWLTNLLMPAEAHALGTAEVETRHRRTAGGDRATAPGPLVLVGNEIGLGVIPMGRETRAFVDALGRLNQAGGRVLASASH